MADFSAAYESLTDQINNYVSNELLAETKWSSIPGGLDKVTTSSMGFVWGIGKGKLFVCQIPCSGDWKEVPISGTILDLVADDTHIYVLCTGMLFIKSANNTDEWIQVSAKNGTSLVSTSSYIWAQDGTGAKFKLAKPGTTGNWIQVDDPSKITITSASSTSLYGVDQSGNAVKSDESFQSGWSAVPELIGVKTSKVFGEIDHSAIYNLDTTNQLKRCASGKCDNVLTNGLTPQNLTINPVSKDIWMTTTTQGALGNIYRKTDNLDTSGIYNTTSSLDHQRDAVVASAEGSFESSTYSGVLLKQWDMIKQFLSRVLPKKPASNDKLKKKIAVVGAETETIENALPLIQEILYILFILIVAYYVLQELAFIAHLVALVIVGYGVYRIYLSYTQ